MRTFTTLSRGACLTKSLFYIKPERLSQMVEMGLIRIPGTALLPPQVAGSLHPPHGEEEQAGWLRGPFPLRYTNTK